MLNKQENYSLLANDVVALKDENERGSCSEEPVIVLTGSGYWYKADVQIEKMLFYSEFRLS